MVFLPLMLIWLRDPMYFNAPSRWAMVALAVSIGLLAPELSSEKHGSAAAAADFSRSERASNEPASPAVAAPVSSSLMREGTRWTNRVGQFNRSDDGWYFTLSRTDLANDQTTLSVSPDAVSPDAAATTPAPTRPATVSRIKVLENLSLQRVAQIIQQDPSDNRWEINGVITEFFGENRLLMVLAVRAPIGDESQR